MNKYLSPNLSINKILQITTVVMILSFIVGCNSNTITEKKETYIKKEQNIMLESEPKSYKKHALVTSGTLKVKGTFRTDGPLADVHANGDIKANALSLDISGKITASNDLSGTIVRSFNYNSPINKDFVKIRALKVDEYLHTSLLDEYYLLTNDGQALHKIKDQNDTVLDNDSLTTSFTNNIWTLSGTEVKLDLPLVVQGDLHIETDYLFIGGTLMVAGNLDAKGELNINTGTPFEKALIVDKNIILNKLTAIGRVHGSGIFTSQSEVNILGNAEIDGDVTLYGDTTINFLDNTYKAALSDIEGDGIDTNTTHTLVHSQLFSNAKGKNSVVLFTFVEGNYLMNEKTINYLIEHNQTSDFKFTSLLYGATIDYGSQLSSIDGLSPYYANKLDIEHKLKEDGHTAFKIKETLDIAPSNLYLTYEEDGFTLNTYMVYSLSTPFDTENLITLPKKNRDAAIYDIDNKDEIEAKQLSEAQAEIEEQKQYIIDNNETNLTIKSDMLNELSQSEDNTTLSKQEINNKNTQDRINEWVEYKDMSSVVKEVTIEDILTKDTNTTATRGWFSRFKKRWKRLWNRPSRSPYKYISGVNKATGQASDTWAKKITIHNNINYCTPVTASMILNYHHFTRKRKGDLNFGKKYASNSPHVLRMAKEFHTSKSAGTAWYRYPFEVPYDTSREIRRLGMYGYAYTWYTAFWNRKSQHKRLKWFIDKNNPIMFHIGKARVVGYDGRYVRNHSMPIIGYREKKEPWYKPNKRWLVVDTLYSGKRGTIRFDIRSNYFRFGAMTYVRVY